MKTDDISERVSEFFRSVAQDWTPTAARSSANILFAPVSSDENVSRWCSTILSDAERKRADSFLADVYKTHFTQRRAFRRFCAALAVGSPDAPLSQMSFDETEEGKPYLASSPELSFSFSSCRFGFLGAWSSTHRIGVDFEDRTQTLEPSELARQFFSEAEAKIVDEGGDFAGRRTFFQLWSLKESALKSIGEGLPFGLDAFGFDLSPELRVIRAPREHGGPERFESHLIEGEKTFTALVTCFK
jgi:4'-phosphopantetheinyl transferase